VVKEVAENSVIKLMTQFATLIVVPFILWFGSRALNTLDQLQEGFHDQQTKMAVMQKQIEIATTDRYTANDHARYSELMNVRLGTLEHRLEQIERRVVFPSGTVSRPIGNGAK
jgi:hypothetical protein